MDAVNKTFISSTFWTERIGSIAALETLKQMEKIKSWKIISEIGKKIKKKWSMIAKSNKIDLKIQGLDALPNFIFNSNNHNFYKTYISQEMLKKKILASNVIYTSISHNENFLEDYFDLLNNLFANINKCENSILNIKKLLETDPASIGMRGK